MSRGGCKWVTELSKSTFHEHNESKMKEEYLKRFNSLASFNTNINIIPMENGKKVNDLEYPLFFMVTKNLSKKTESHLN